MVIRDDDLHSSCLKLGNGVDIRDAAVDRDKKVRILLQYVLDDVLGKAVAVLLTVRNDIGHVAAVASEIPYKYRSRGNAVAVVIAVDEDLSLGGHRFADDVDGLSHVVIKVIFGSLSVLCNLRSYQCLRFLAAAEYGDTQSKGEHRTY